MARRALTVSGWVCSTLAFAFAACGEPRDDERAERTPGEAGEGGETTDTGGASPGAGNGGSNAQGGSRGGTTSRGGRAGQAGAPSGGNAGTTSGTGGTVAGGEGGGAGMSEGGSGGDGEPVPVVCDRLGTVASAAIAQRVALTYDRTRHRDCRLGWFTTLWLPPVDERAEYLNRIIRQTLAFWGCVEGPPAGFSLVHGVVPLSRAEVDALVEVYLNASRIEAQLSPAELAPIERALQRLGAPLVEPTLDDFSRSTCPGDGSGGQGGSDGGGGVSASR
ncbi:MAG TPA: hypothetical protein VFZ53_27735 [Polyangiaceae bacterium]